MSMHKDPHVCGEKFCSICKEFVKPSHRCYIKPEDTAEEVEDELDDLGRNGKKKKQKYIFFDFECTQDQMMQCEKGFMRDENSGKCCHCNESSCGTFKHVPNLCVAHKVCESCMIYNVTCNSYCSRCGKNEKVFAGADARNEFCTWLFSEKNTGATVFCHNFKGYDSYPIMSYLYENAILPIIIKNG